MKRIKKITISVLGLLLVLALGTGISFGWLSETNEIRPEVSSGVIRQYFERGKGTADDPFVIHTPRHLYNLAWLQYLGMFNRTNSDGTVTQYYFELCAAGDTDCVYETGITDSLDMTGWTLPPIGTAQYPFVGNFNGNGVTLSNLTVSSHLKYMSDPAMTQDIFAQGSYSTGVDGSDILGFFGVIGNTDKTTYTYNSSVNTVTNLILSNITVNSETSTSLMGVVAGYVNGTVSNVKVSGTASVNKTAGVTNTSITSNVSDYTLFGYVTDTYKTNSQAVFVSIDTPTNQNSQYTYSSQGNTAGWGGSIDMYGLLSRIDAIGRASVGGVTGTTKPQIPLTETVTVDLVAGTTDTVVTSYYSGDILKKGSNANGDTVNSYYYYSPEAGSYHYYQSKYSNQPHNYLTGLNDVQQKKTVTTITYQTNADGTDYLKHAAMDFYSNGNYLNYVNGTLTGGDTATSHWQIDSNGYLSTYDSSYQKVYLNAAANNTYTFGTTGSTQWTYNGEQLYYFDSENTMIFLNYGTQWQLAERPYRTISYNGNYLAASGTTLVNATTVGKNTQWYELETTGGSLLYRYVNGVVFYLYHNDTTLGLTNNENDATVWVLDSNRVYEKDDTVNKITILNGTWSYNPDTKTEQMGNNLYYIYTVVNGTNNYLSYSLDSSNVPSGPINTTEKNAAKLWVITTDPTSLQSGTIMTNTTGAYYFRVSNNGSTSTGLRVNEYTTNSTWTYSTKKNNGYLSVPKSDNGNKVYYIYLNNGAWDTTDNQNTASAIQFEQYTEIVTNSYPSATISALAGTATVSKKDVAEKDPPVTTTSTGRSGIMSYIPLTTVGTADQMRAYTSSSSTDIFNTAPGNTGYIVGGLYDNSDTEKADVRISAYPIASINNSYDSTSNAFTHIYTINASGEIEVDLANGTYDNGKKFTRYKKALQQLKETLLKTNTSNAGNAVYGIHFMNALISTDRLITAPKVTINGQTYTNYQLPEDSIDFNLVQRGYITLFAGSYHPSNNSLFSLNTIIRDENQKIVSIKEIRYIYSSGNARDPYIYQYSDGTFSDGVSRASNVTSFTGDGDATYTMVMDLKWLGKSGYISGYGNKVYYFEIPVNAGEYALGSVSGATGAYLIYLDIGANAQTVNRAEIVENFEETTKTYRYPIGATFANAGDSTLPKPSLLGSMDSSTNKISVTVNSNISLTESGMKSVQYVGPGVTVNDTASLIKDAPCTQEVVTKVRRTTYYDYNIPNTSYTITEVEVRKTGNAAEVITINAWKASNTDGVWTKGTQILENYIQTDDSPQNYPAEDGFAAYYLLDVGEGDSKETLRFEDGVFNALSDSSVIKTERHNFLYQIDDNSATKINYAFSCTIKEDFDQENPKDLYIVDLANGTYNVTVNTVSSVTIQPASQTNCTVNNTLTGTSTSTDTTE